MPKDKKKKIIAIDGVIGFDVESNKIREQIESADGADIVAEISSPGGFVFSGLQIFNLFKNYEGHTTAKIIGLAASMSSYIPMAFDSVEVEDNAVFMIHNARQGMAGDHNDMRKAADLLERLSAMLAKAYISKTGKSEKKIRKMMDEETYLFGDEIVKAGFADKVIKTDSENPNKAESVDFAKARIAYCIDKVKAKDKGDLEQAAALLEPEEKKPILTESEIEALVIVVDDSMKAQSTNNESEPAPAGDNKSEVVNMKNLQALLSEHPEAKAEFDKKLEAGEAEIKTRVEAARPYLSPESKYGNAIKNKALKVVTGEASIEALHDMVAVIDEISEKESSDDAKAESTEQGDVKAEQHSVGSDSEKIETREDEQALVNKLREA